MQLKEISTKEEIAKTFAVLKQLYKNLEETKYVDEILKMFEKNYKMAAVFEENQECIGVIGIRISTKISLKETLEIEDFMIHRQKRGIGVGKMLLKWADWQALSFNCKNIIANLQTKRKESQTIFSREKFLIDGFSMKKEL